MIKRYSHIIGLAGFFMGLAALLFFAFSGPKVGYVDTIKVYNGFKFKIELERKLSGVQKSRQMVLDSLLAELNALKEGKLNASLPAAQRSALFASKQEEYLLLEEKYQQDNESAIGHYQEQIWKQLNQYLKDYGREYGYDFIWGASGDGSLVYSNYGHDLTDDVLKYVNQRYNDEHK
ncbi:MAG: OmpH family outer membrane protein [Bacteroidetes bacterium]|nr:OmpH family outer membrane protein [Bacteroidota bacterium]